MFYDISRKNYISQTEKVNLGYLLLGIGGGGGVLSNQGILSQKIPNVYILQTDRVNLGYLFLGRGGGALFNQGLLLQKIPNVFFNVAIAVIQ